MSTVMRTLSAIARIAAIASIPAAPAIAQGPDSAKGEHEKGFPWIAHSSAEAFLLPTPASSDGGRPYQISLYQGFTIQSLSFAWFHLGLRSRETMARGFSRPYREPASIKLGVGAEVVRDFLYVTLGGNVPVLGGGGETADTLAYYRAMNGYNPMPQPSFFSPRALHAGAYARHGGTNWTLLGGIGFSRPARFELVEDKPFFPSSYIEFMSRAIRQTKRASHRWDLKWTRYGEEGSEQRIPAHDEGDLMQFRYGYINSTGKVGRQAGLGLAAKLPDANRRLKLASELEPPERDDNIQRAYAEFVLAWAPNPDIRWRFHLLPKALLTWDMRDPGHEIEGGMSVGLKAWDVHRARWAGNLLYGAMDGRTYVGLGMRAEFSFRHLGSQDLQDAAGSGEGE